MPQPAAFVRSVQPDDAPSLATLLTELGYPSEENGVRRRVERLTAGSALAFAAVQEHVVLGVGTLHFLNLLTEDRPIAKLTSLVVAQFSRGRGIGRLLVRHACDEARARGCARMLLTTHLRRTEAHAFYERLGFEFTGRRYVITL